MEIKCNPKDALMKALTITLCATVARRVICAVLLAYGIGMKEAAAFAGVCLKSARKYNTILGSADASGLLCMSARVHPWKLSSVKELLLAELDKGLYKTLRQIRFKIKEAFGIEISRGRISAFLAVNGYRLMRSASLPAKADFAEQRRFYREELLLLMAAAKRGELALQFMDAAHFVFGVPTPGAVYTKVRRAIKTFSGRTRYNVLASLDFVTKEITMVANDTYIRAAQVMELFEKLAVQYVGKTIVVVLDNAKYQHCDAVEACADRLGILLSYLPTYSPNLNLIERFWKYIKHEVLDTAYFGSFEDFTRGITAGINGSCKVHKDRLDTLIDYKVQLYDDQGVHIPFDELLSLLAS